MKRTTIRQCIFTVLGAVAICLALGAAHHLDVDRTVRVEHSTFGTADELNGALLGAQDALREYERARRLAIERCRAERGPDALVWETPEGHIVCRRHTTGGTV